MGIASGLAAEARSQRGQRPSGDGDDRPRAEHGEGAIVTAAKLDDGSESDEVRTVHPRMLRQPRLERIEALSNDRLASGVLEEDILRVRAEVVDPARVDEALSVAVVNTEPRSSLTPIDDERRPPPRAPPRPAARLGRAR